MSGRLFAILALVAVLLQTTSGPVRAADPYLIDVILPMTGQAAFIGQSEWPTIQSLEAQTNRTGGIQGRPLRFVIHDDQSSPANAAQLMAEVVAKKVAVVLGSSLSAMCQAMAPLAKDGPVEYCYSPAIHPPAGSFVFSGNSDTRAFVIAFYRYFVTHDIKRIGVIFSTDASGQDAEAAFDRELADPEFRNSGLSIVDREHFTVTDLSTSAQMARVKSSGAQAVIAYAQGTPFATLLRSIRDTGLDVPVFTSSANMSLPEMKQFASLLPRDLYFAGFGVLANFARNAKHKAAQERFLAGQREAGIQPDANSLSGWDASVIVVDALRSIGPAATAEQLRKYIAGLHDYYGALGLYDFRDGSQRGLTPDNIVVQQWDPTKTSWHAVSDFGGLPLKGNR